MNTKEKIEAFRASCRVYKKEKENISQMDYDTLSEGDKQLYVFMKEDTEYVEKTFDKLAKECGNVARMAVWLLFVEGRTQESVAEQYGVTRRTVQYQMNKWLTKVL